MKNLNEMTTKELKEMAKELKISNWWNLKKAVLIEKIIEKQNLTYEEKQAIADQKAKEDAAMEAYSKDWRKYTDRFNPVEFMEKFRSGEIVLDGDEKRDVENLETETSESEETPEPKLVPMPGADKLAELKSEDQPAEQPKQKRGALIEFDGKSQNICKWGEELGISANTLYGRIYKMGWSVERAFTTPARKTK